ncbi:hypothetical protein DFP72DRAFT_1059321 [Ephemerocybe angulata]|uniref:Uncharacterized protein n=1 Tax=Ephemerocybe angulata TaxID=980116 RepID=A0A8H6IHC5_9AGAR|nr:hypothetical protein DFP72DRAFT_1059321 [Tulosesus angulatus]
MAPSDKDPGTSEPSKDTAIKPVEASDVAPTKPADHAADPKHDDNQESTTTEFDEDEYSESDDDFPQFEGYVRILSPTLRRRSLNQFDIKYTADNPEARRTGPSGGETESLPRALPVPLPVLPLPIP